MSFLERICKEVKILLWVDIFENLRHSLNLDEEKIM